MEPYQKTFLDLTLTYEALRFGEFTLKSGRKSPYFFNMGQFYDGAALTTLGECYAAAIKQSGLDFDVLFGPAYKGIPLACTTAIALQLQFQQNVPYCYNRKENKTHGEGGIIVGAPLKGRVLLVDDVISAGTAIRESQALIQATSATLSAVCVALDRQERGEGNLSAVQEIREKWQIPVIALVNLDTVIQYASTHPALIQWKEALLAYQQQYAAK